MKDLRLQSIEQQPDASAMLRLTANRWKHDRDLTLVYSGVVELNFDGKE